MKEKLKEVLLKKECSNPEEIANKISRFLDHPILVGFDYQDVFELLSKGNEIKLFKESEKDELKAFNPKAVLILILGNGITLDEIGAKGEEFCNLFGEDVQVTWAADEDENNLIEVIAVR